MEHHLFTIGYEQLELADLITELRVCGIHTLVDVRELPLSRKPGLSKNGLKQALAENGIAYWHLRPLGCPRDIRHTYRTDHNWRHYTAGYLAYLTTQQEAVDELSRYVTNHRCALLCFEADAATCHRSFIARAVQESLSPKGLAVIHLYPQMKDINKSEKAKELGVAAS